MALNHTVLTACLLFSLMCLVTSPVAAGKDGSDSRGKGRDFSSGNGMPAAPGSSNLDQWWQNLPQNDRQMLRDRHEIFQSLPPEQRERLNRRWENYRQMSPEERQQMQQKFRRWQTMDPEERDRLRGTYRKFKDLPDDRRRQLQDDLDQLRDLEPTERDRSRREIYKRYFPKDYD